MGQHAQNSKKEKGVRANPSGALVRDRSKRAASKLVKCAVGRHACRATAPRSAAPRAAAHHRSFGYVFTFHVTSHRAEARELELEPRRSSPPPSQCSLALLPLSVTPPPMSVLTCSRALPLLASPAPS
jgi:hypothetical protein